MTSPFVIKTNPEERFTFSMKGQIKTLGMVIAVDYLERDYENCPMNEQCIGLCVE